MHSPRQSWRKKHGGGLSRKEKDKQKSKQKESTRSRHLWEYGHEKPPTGKESQ